MRTEQSLFSSVRRGWYGEDVEQSSSGEVAMATAMATAMAMAAAVAAAVPGQVCCFGKYVEMRERGKKGGIFERRTLYTERPSGRESYIVYLLRRV